jgi:very-short-patch-repair endonuclease
MKSRGLRVIRFRNEALEKDIWRVVEEIKRAPGECEAPAKKKLELPSGAREES